MVVGNPTSPNSGLHVLGGPNGYGYLTLENTASNKWGVGVSTTSFQIVGNPTANVFFHYDVTNNIIPFATYNGNTLINGVVGSGAPTTIDATLKINGKTSNSLEYALKVNNDSSNSLLYIRNDGNISIGLTQTSYKLEVSGTVSTTGFRMTNGASNGYYLQSDGSGNATWASLVVSGNGVTASGTTNYISKFTNSNVLGNSQIFDNGTNIGIGTASPSYKLDVSGETRIVSNTATAFQVGNGPSNIHLTYDGTTGGTTMYKLSSQNFKTESDGTTRINGSILMFYNDAAVNAYQVPLRFIRSYPQFGTQSGFIFDNDNSGGGTASPTYRIIDLKSDGVSRNYFTPTKAYFTQILEMGDPSDGRVFFRVDNKGKTILTDYEFNTSTDIGNNGSTVSTRLFVGANLDDANAIVLNGGGSGGGNYGQNAIYFADGRKSLAAIKALSSTPFNYADLAFYTTPNTNTTTLAERMRITNDGYVGINTTSPTAKLQITGSGSGTSSYSIIVKNSSNSELINVNDAGNVMLNTSNPDSLNYKLEINSNTYGLKIGNTASHINNSGQINGGNFDISISKVNSSSVIALNSTSADKMSGIFFVEEGAYYWGGIQRYNSSFPGSLAFNNQTNDNRMLISNGRTIDSGGYSPITFYSNDFTFHPKNNGTLGMVLNADGLLVDTKKTERTTDYHGDQYGLISVESVGKHLGSRYNVAFTNYDTSAFSALVSGTTSFVSGNNYDYYNYGYRSVVTQINTDSATGPAGPSRFTNIGYYANVSGNYRNYAFIAQNGDSGFGVTSPNYRVDVSGTVSTTGFRMTNGASSGYYLQSDASGNATWAAIGTVSGNGVTASGTTNYVSKFTSSNVLGNSIIQDDGSTVTISGNLTVVGTSSTVNTVNLTVQDPIILLSSTQSGSPVLDSGIMVRRGTGATQAMIWDESADEFIFAYTNDSDNVIGNMNISGYSPLKSGDYIIIGSGTTSATSGFTVKDSSSNELFRVKNDGMAYIKGTMHIGYGNDPNNSKLNVAIGDSALGSYVGTFGQGANIAVGNGSQQSTTTGQYNTSVGHLSLSNNTTGSYNTSINRALSNNTTGSYNIGIGSSALSSSSTTSYNIGIGDNALQALTSGTNNIAIGGYAALYALTSGSSNIALGYFAGVYMSTGSANTIVGHQSLSNNPFSGSNNTIFGASNFTTIISGTANTVIGRNIESWSSNLSNHILIGDGDGNIRMMSDNTGKVGIGLTGPSANLHVRGNTSSTVFRVDGISGLPVLEAFSDNTILLGDYSAPALFTTTNITTTQSQTDIYSIATASYTGAYYDYTIVNGSNARSGSIQAIWLAGSLQYNETSTMDIGTTSGFTFSVVASGTYSVLRSNASTNGWVVKTIIRSI